MTKNTNKSRTYDNIEFLVSIGEFKLRLSLPKNTTVGGLVAIVKGYEALHLQYGPHGTTFIGIASTVLNPLLDYWLTQPQLDFIKFKKKLELRSLYTTQRRAQKLCSGDFQFLVCLGQGACGSVYLVRNRASGAVHALKRVAKSTIKDYHCLMTLFREKKNLIRMGINNHTVNMHACFQSRDHFNFLMDYYPGGELFLHLSQLKQRMKLNSFQIKLYFCQILLAMEYIHKRKVLYRDLKPQNIFIDILGHIRIGDFGLSKSDFQEDDFAVSMCGSPQYMAPEVLDNQNYNFSADFYSIGAILYEFLTGVPPYYNEKIESDEQRLALMKNMSLDLSKATSDIHLQQLLVNLLHPNPDRRISNFQEVKNSPWLTGVDWKSLQLKQEAMPFAPDPSAPIQAYIGKQFLALQKDVHEINRNSEDQPFVGQISDLFQYIKPQSRKILGLQLDFAQMPKPKTKGSMKQKKEKLPKKANLSVALFDRQQTICQSVCSQPRTVKTVKGQNKENQGIMHQDRSKKVVVNLSKQGSTIIFGKTNLNAQPSSTNRQKTQRSVLTPVSNTSSECSSRAELMPKGTSRGRDLFRGQSRQCKSKGKSKQKTLKENSLSKNGPIRKKQQKRVLPTCSFKIKLG